MFLKKSLSVCFFALLLFSLLLLSVPGIAQDYYTFVWKLDGIFARGIAVDSQNNIYISDNVNNCIKKFGKNGNFLKQWGTFGTGNGEFNSPYGIAIDKNDNVFVADRGNNRIQKFDSEGNFITTWGGLPPNISNPDYFMWGPRSVACDTDGNVYVVAAFEGEIYPIKKFDSAGGYLGGFGKFGYYSDPPPDDDPYNFVYPDNIAVNTNKDIFISVGGDYSINYPSQIKKFGPSFIFVKRWLLDSVDGIAIDNADNVLACSWRNQEHGVWKYDSDGTLIQRIAPDNCSMMEDGTICNPNVVACDSEGNVYVGDLHGRIQKFTPPLKYNFEGFFSPIDNPPTVNKANASQTIPIKWRITDKDGLPVSDPASFVSIQSTQVPCDTFTGGTNNVTEPATGSSGLQYLGNGYWQYNWRTSRGYAGQCRIMTLTLGDHSTYTASFSFR